MTSKMMHNSGSRNLMFVEELAMVLPFCQYPLLTSLSTPFFFLEQGTGSDESGGRVEENIRGHKSFYC